MKLSLIVIRATNITENVDFYSQLGMSFIEEKHGSGPLHYSSVFMGAVFEVYPCRPDELPSNVRLGFRYNRDDAKYISVLDFASKSASTSRIDSDGYEVFIVTDPDKRKIELGFKQ